MQGDPLRLQLGRHPAHERAPAVHAAGVGEREVVVLAEVAGLGLDARRVDRLGLTVTPRSIAKGRASPPL